MPRQMNPEQVNYAEQVSSKRPLTWNESKKSIVRVNYLIKAAIKEGKYLFSLPAQRRNKFSEIRKDKHTTSVDNNTFSRRNVISFQS